MTNNNMTKEEKLEALKDAESILDRIEVHQDEILENLKDSVANNRFGRFGMMQVTGDRMNMVDVSADEARVVYDALIDYVQKKRRAAYQDYRKLLNEYIKD